MPPFDLKTIVVSVGVAVATFEHMVHGAKVPMIPEAPIKPVKPISKTEHIEVVEPEAPLAHLDASQYGGLATALPPGRRYPYEALWGWDRPAEFMQQRPPLGLLIAAGAA
jgi:hypothetical protein